MANMDFKKWVTHIYLVFDYIRDDEKALPFPIRNRMQHSNITRNSFK